MSVEVMKQALDALERIGMKDWVERKEYAITALRQAIEQPEQEPVAWLDVFTDEAYSNSEIDEEAKADLTPLYTAPPRKEWVELTDEEINEIQYSDNGVEYELFDEGDYGTAINIYPEKFARAIEAKLKEKNT